MNNTLSRSMVNLDSLGPSVTGCRAVVMSDLVIVAASMIIVLKKGAPAAEIA